MIIPVIRHYTITGGVEITIDGPFSYAEAVRLAEEVLTRLDPPPGARPLNGIREVRVTSVHADRR